MPSAAFQPHVWGSRDGAVVEHLPPTQASHQCGPGSIRFGVICGLSLLLVLVWRCRCMKNVVCATHARERDTRWRVKKERLPERPTKIVSCPLSPSNCTRERNERLVCQLKVLCRSTIDVFLILHLPRFAQIV